MNENTNESVSIPQHLISDVGLAVGSDELLSFMRKAIEMREHFKFVFTKSLSRVLELIASLAQKLGFSRKDMSYFDVNEILSFSFYGTEDEIRHYIVREIPLRKAERAEMSKLILPPVITNALDFDVIQTADDRPNFVTAKTVKTETIVLDTGVQQDVAGKIVIIEKADPGYDWIFAKGIAGLITRYGVAVDDSWKDYWQKRYGRVDFDTESLAIDTDCNITELGLENPRLEDISARYIGLLKFSKKGLSHACAILEAAYRDFADKPWQQSGKPVRKAYMTDLLNALIQSGENVKAVHFEHGWIEFDTNEDYESACRWAEHGELSEIIRL